MNVIKYDEDWDAFFFCEAGELGYCDYLWC